MRVKSRVDQSERQSYYGEGRQPWDDIVEAGFGPAFAAGSILKYIRRTKGEREKDIEKARWYWEQLLAIASGSDEGPALAADTLSWLGQVLTKEERALLHG